jgi:hypothetical protein
MQMHRNRAPTSPRMPGRAIAYGIFNESSLRTQGPIRRGLSFLHGSRGLFSLLKPGVMGPCVRRDDPLRDCAKPRSSYAIARPHAGRGSRWSVNAFLTINWAKIAEWSLSIVSRVKRGDYPWTPVRCLTFETGVLRPPRRRLAPATGMRGGKQQRWSTSRQVKAGRREADFRVSAKSAPS